MKNNVIKLNFNECQDTVKSNAFTDPLNDVFHRLLNDEDPIICVKSILCKPARHGGFELKCLVAIPSHDKWISIFNTYDSFEKCRLLGHDLLNNVLDSATIFMDDISFARSELNSCLNINTGFSILLPTNFTFKVIRQQ